VQARRYKRVQRSYAVFPFRLLPVGQRSVLKQQKEGAPYTFVLIPPHQTPAPNVVRPGELSPPD
jgi:hypothetical protein